MASIDQKPSRYAHTDGHTDLTFDPSVTDYPGQFLTCGSDGDVRIWNGLEDDSPIGVTLGDSALGLACRPPLAPSDDAEPEDSAVGGRFVAGSSDTHGIHAFDLPDGTPDGIVARFTAPVTCLCYSPDGKILAGGACDFQIKVIYQTEMKTLTGHSAPLLSLNFDPSGTQLASSACDGSIKIWDLSKDQSDSCVKTLSDVFPKSNDFENSKTLCRICWSSDGTRLFVPAVGGVKVFNASTWEFQFTLTDESLTVATVAVFSNCGNFLAVSSTNGQILIFNVATKKCLVKREHEKKLTVCSLAWNPTVPAQKKEKQELVYCDTDGQLGWFQVRLEGSSKAVAKPLTTPSGTEDFQGLFDDDDDDDSAFVAASQAAMEPNPDAADEDDASRDSFGAGGDGATSRAKNDQVQKVFVESGPKLPTPQDSFQPSATPRHLSNRFMVWNSVGIIRQHKSMAENAVDIEFHDTSIHHAIHYNNTDNHIMADMNEQLVAMASEGTSKLCVMHIGSWDAAKEWTVPMPDEEDIEAVAVGFNWVVVATSKRYLRLYSAAGIQREVLTLPGPVVCMAGRGSELIVAYHDGVGVSGDQKLSILHYRFLGGKPYSFKLTTYPVALSPKATLEWLGFSLEGSPVTVDSKGLIQLTKKQINNQWVEIANTRQKLSTSDNYFVIGVSEYDSHIRCIFCKACAYPAVLPKPLVQILPITLPMADGETEKGAAESTFWTSALLAENDRSHMTRQEQLIKMLALACKADRDFRVTEVASLFPTAESLQLAIKYATRLGKINLASRIGEIALQRRQELQTRAPDPDEDEAEDDPPDSQMPLFDDSPPAEKESEVDEDEDEEDSSLPLLQVERKTKPFTPLVPSVKETQDSSKKGNPFKKQLSDDLDSKSSNVFLALAQPTLKKTASFSGTTNSRFSKNAAPTSGSDVIKPPPVKRKTGAQAKISTLARSMSMDSPKPKPKLKVPVTSTPVESTSTLEESPFLFWKRCNLDSIMQECPCEDDDEEAVTQHCMKKFRELPTSERKEWIEKYRSQKDSQSQQSKESQIITEKNSNTQEPVNNKKRKLDEEAEEPLISKKVGNGASEDKEQKPPTKVKLAAFAFTSDD